MSPTSGSRQALLVALRRSDRPLDATEAGRTVGLHRNSARAHLDLLVSIGLVRRQAEQRNTRGRPRVLYDSAPAPSASPDAPRTDPDIDYRELARLLAHQLSEMDEAASEAVRAGRRWAAAFDSTRLSAGSVASDDAMGAVAGLLARLGFEPEPQLGEGRILLRRCPVAEVAKESRVVVCGMHLGMLKATLEALDAPFEVTGLHPFVEDDPLLCVVNVAARPSPRTGAAPRAVAVRVRRAKGRAAAPA